MVTEGSLGEFLLDSMKKKSLSMRKLGKDTGIDPAVISKIVNGKRKANLNHLQKFSNSLEVPLPTLIHLSGYSLGGKKAAEDRGELHFSVNHIQAMLTHSRVKADAFSMERIEHLLSHYESFGATQAGRKTIRNAFKEKLKTVGSAGFYMKQLEEMYHYFRLQKGSKKRLLIMGSALLYFIFTLDAIPDYIFAVGYLDDAFVVQYITHMLSVTDS
ncbi:Helix-turn-helix [Oceanobacillus limi]|uniref:Helix-turn-helix n=2 Tax=Oceanobacillus limi TaxID=930131 RepID=A0A1I0GBX5_9BACI|nr:Helix-turn-helix [Oceanobacillus limi]